MPGKMCRGTCSGEQGESAPFWSCTLLLMTPLEKKTLAPDNVGSLPMRVPACRAHMLWGWRGPLGHPVPA